MSKYLDRVEADEWMLQHLIDRRSELLERGAPTEILLRYNRDIEAMDKLVTERRIENEMP